jgi:glycosyltransferase involved in cell wall biosynthesis
MPFPLTAGDRIYSFNLAAALAKAGAKIIFVGLHAAVAPQSVPGITWHVVPGGQRNQLHALFSRLPLVAARHATRAYRAEVARLLQVRSWDAVVIDHYGSGWVRFAIEKMENRPLTVFVTHNHEASVTESQLRISRRSLARRLYSWQNWKKTVRLEKSVARKSDLITAITDVDAERLRQDAPNVAVIQLAPGYNGVRLIQRKIEPTTPRAIILLGSYLWSAKQASLKLFLEQAAPVLAAAAISIDVVGDMNSSLLQGLRSKYPDVQFHGFVEDAAALLASARIAVIAEPVGGGFKLKLLEYIFNRVPVASLEICASGLPESVRSHLLLAHDIGSLLVKVMAELDDLDRLNARHKGAFAAADEMFDWDKRGRTLMAAIKDGHERSVTGMEELSPR